MVGQHFINVNVTEMVFNAYHFKTCVRILLVNKLNQDFCEIVFFTEKEQNNQKIKILDILFIYIF